MIEIIQVDAFTSEPFRGNPAAVVVLGDEAPSEWMQAVAAEMNLSETAYLSPANDGYRLRWFTPAVEVDLCGHATLASAHVLWERGHLSPDFEAVFHTNSGRLSAKPDNEWIMLDFPSEPPRSEANMAQIANALGFTPHSAWINRFDILVEVEDEATVRNFEPDFTALAQLDCRGLIVTSQADNGSADFVSRFFAPGVGINEDPVTGSAHCFLAPFWAERLGKTTMIGYQASKRGGTVKVDTRGDRVAIGGQAVTVLEAKLLG